MTPSCARTISRVTPVVVCAEIVGLRTALDTTLAAWKRPGAEKIPENVQKAAEDLSKQVNEVAAKFANPPEEPGGEQGGAGPALVYRPPTLTQRVNEEMGSLQGMSEAPTASELAELDLLTKEVADALPQVDKLVKEGLPNLNKLMNEAGVPHIVIPQPGAGPRRTPARRHTEHLNPSRNGVALPGARPHRAPVFFSAIDFGLRCAEEVLRRRNIARRLLIRSTKEICG